MWVKMRRSRPEAGMVYLRQGLYDLPEKLALRFIADGEAVLPDTDERPADRREKKIVSDYSKR
jgi:hypothetical protein